MPSKITWHYLYILMNDFIKEVYQNILDIYMPMNCYICNDVTYAPICDKCALNLEYIDIDSCKICGKRIESDKEICNTCQESPPYFKRCQSAVAYNELSAHIIKAFKYYGRIDMGIYMADIIEKNINIPQDIDFITSIPMHPLKKLFRKFDHSQILAKYIAQRNNIPYLKISNKIKLTKRQALISHKDRHENITGSFQIIKSKSDIIYKKKILIIDDVTTTGSTINEMSKILSRNGAVSTAITFANARYL